MEYLYHYTSIETLEKILDSGAIRFSRLDLVDDMEEAAAEDIKNFGKFIFVSCWTNDERESIPMWNIYTPNMQGVRIKLREFPFRRYYIPTGMFNNEKPVHTFINAEEREKENLPFILLQYPQLIEIFYTEQKKLIYPHIKTSRTQTIPVTTKNNRTGQTQISKRVLSSTKTYNTDQIGMFKRTCWNFQKEWRYRLFLSPYTFKELKECNTRDDHARLIHRLEEEEYYPTEEEIFLKLDREAISEMEILTGPRVNDDMMEQLLHVIERYGISATQIRKSELKIR